MRAKRVRSTRVAVSVRRSRPDEPFGPRPALSTSSGVPSWLRLSTPSQRAKSRTVVYATRARTTRRTRLHTRLSRLPLLGRRALISDQPRDHPMTRPQRAARLCIRDGVPTYGSRSLRLLSSFAL